MPTAGGRSDHAKHQPRPRNPVARPLTVLLVDDTHDVRDLYAQYLSVLGCRVVTAPDGAAGIVAATQGRPDVIVMDLAMPKMDGITAIKHLRTDARTRRIPVILLTGYPHEAIAQGTLEAGADVFLTKPCLPEDLHAHIIEMSARRSRRAA